MTVARHFRDLISNTRCCRTRYHIYTALHTSNGFAGLRRAPMSLSPSFAFLVPRSCRTSLGSLPPFSLATLPATFRLPYCPSRMRPVTQKRPYTPARLVGQSGCTYSIERVLQQKESPSRHVYLATSGNRKFVLKDVSQSDFNYLRDMHRDIRSCSNLRVAQDSVPEQSIFVYKYFSDDLLGLIQKDISIKLKKRILKDSLRGLAALHDQHIVHTDIKANNVLVEQEENNGEMIIKQVQLADIEDAAYVPPGSDIVGKAVGNWMWRSPEAHAQGPVNKPSDIFSFGAVCIYAVLKLVIFAVDENELADGEEVLSVVLERQISYFADEDGLNGLLEYLGDSPWSEIFKVIRDGFNETNPRKPFSLWKDVDEDFKDLIAGLMNFDPMKRLTAREALAHRWFSDV